MNDWGIERTSTEVLVTLLDVEVDLVGDFGALCGLHALRAEESRDSDEHETEGEPSEEHFGDEGRKERGGMGGKTWQLGCIETCPDTRFAGSIPRINSRKIREISK